jgi:long-chain acyl-CoA synthetase
METLPAILQTAFEKRARDDVLVERVAGVWTPTSTATLRTRIARTASSLHASGLRAGDRVALLSPNCIDWVVADLGILFAGCVVVPIFATQALDQVAFILNHSQSAILFVDTPARRNVLRDRAGIRIPIIAFDDETEEGMAAFETRGTERFEAPAIGPNDLAVLIYTSGTTGEPKGVMLSHRNLATTTKNAFDYAFPALSGGDNTLTILPFAHIYEHIVLYGKLLRAVSLHICRDSTNLLRDLQDVKPVLMTAVPRIFEHVLGGILMKAKSAGGLRAKLVPWALRIGREYMRAFHFSRPSLVARMQYALAHRLVLRKLRPLLGLSELRFFVSGSATLHVDLALTFAAADIVIVEGYGTTECSPVITVNRLQDNRLGTVGKPIPHVDVRLAPDGEILVRGPGVMLGYYKDDAANAAVFDGDWYRTGDVGEIDADGYLRIVDRKKELFKTTGGKFIAPARIESALARSPFIAQVAVVAEGRDVPAALIAPNRPFVRSELGIDAVEPDDTLWLREDVRALIRREVATYSRDLAPYERVRHVALLPRDLTIEDGELSPTLKIRRRVVEERFTSLLDT